MGDGIYSLTVLEWEGTLEINEFNFLTFKNKAKKHFQDISKTGRDRTSNNQSLQQSEEHESRKVPKSPSEQHSLSHFNYPSPIPSPQLCCSLENPIQPIITVKTSGLEARCNRIGLELLQSPILRESSLFVLSRGRPHLQGCFSLNLSWTSTSPTAFSLRAFVKSNQRNTEIA